MKISRFQRSLLQTGLVVLSLTVALKPTPNFAAPLKIDAEFQQIPLVALKPTPSLAAQSTAPQVISRETALQQSPTLLLAPGRITIVNFNRTNETIIYAGLGDPSATVFNLDLPLSSRRAKSVFLRRIRPLHFSNATTATTTNLIIKTIDPQEIERTYSFDIVPTQTKSPTNLTIAAAIAGQQTLNSPDHPPITLQNIKSGLSRAISLGYTRASDPIVSKTKRFLTLAHTQDINLVDLANQLKLKIDVLVSLGKLGQQRFYKNV